ncbi:MAG: hypothetical protein ACRETG_13520 [Steroidobacteraceae bacterium]
MAQLSFEFYMIEAKPENLIGDRSNETPVAETGNNVRRQQEPRSRSPMRRFSPAGYQRRQGATEDVETGEALDVRRGKPVEEGTPPAVTKGRLES